MACTECGFDSGMFYFVCASFARLEVGITSGLVSGVLVVDHAFRSNLTLVLDPF